MDTAPPSISPVRALLELLVVAAVLAIALVGASSDAAHDLLLHVPYAWRVPVGVFVQGQVAIVVVLAVVVRDRDPWAALGLRPPSSSSVWTGALLGLSLTVGVFGALFLAAAALARSTGIPLTERGAGDLTVPPALTQLAAVPAWGIVPLVLFVAFYEEVLFRGFLLGRLRAMFGGTSRLATALALVVSSAIFGALHVYKTMTGVIVTCFIGLFLGLLAVGKRQILSSIVVHAGIDAAALFAMHALLAGK